MIKKIFVLLPFVATQAIGQTEIYNEDFQSGLPATYTLVDNDGFTPNAAVSQFANAWIELTDPNNPNDTIVGSTSYFEPVGQSDRWLITPAITLGNFGNIAYWEARSHDPSFPDSYFVLVSKTDTQLSSFTDTLISVTSEYPDWTSREGNLSELGLDNETIHLAFVNRTNNGFKLYIDDIRVVEEDPAGIQQLDIVKISIYPNPSSNTIHISGIQDIRSVMIISMDGKRIAQGSEASMDISTLEAGRYLIEVNSDTEVARSYFIKL